MNRLNTQESHINNIILNDKAKIIFDTINNLRTNPIEYINEFSIASKALQRAKRKQQSIDIEKISNRIILNYNDCKSVLQKSYNGSFINKNNSPLKSNSIKTEYSINKKIINNINLNSNIHNVYKKNLTILELSKGLCKASEEILNSIIYNALDLLNFSNNNSELILEHLKNNLSEFNESNIHLITDSGEIESNNISTRLLISEDDVDKNNIKYIFDEDSSKIGIHSKLLDKDSNEYISIILIADKDIIEKEELEDNSLNADDYNDINLDDDTYPMIKQIFNTLDQFQTGLLDAEEIYNALMTLNYKNKNPKMIKLFDSLRIIDNKNNKLGINYNTFKKEIIKLHVHPIDTINDWKNVFNLFVDNVSKNTISIGNIVRICKFIDEDTDDEKLIKYISIATKNAIELNFEEFYSIMCC